MGLKIEMPKDINKLKKQINALESIISKDTPKDKETHKAALKSLYEELLYREYLELQSKEFKADIKGYEELVMQGKDLAIKVIFKSFWLRVYRTKRGEIEWY